MGCTAQDRFSRFTAFLVSHHNQIAFSIAADRQYFFHDIAPGDNRFIGHKLTLIVSFLNDPRACGSTTPLKLFFGDTFFFWLVLLFVTPVLTMRLLAEERLVNDELFAEVLAKPKE